MALLLRIARVWRYDRPEAGPAWRSSVTAVLTATAAPLGVAVLLAVISAGVGAASQPLTDRAEFTSGASVAASVPSEVPWCLSGPRDWSPSSADCPDTVEPGEVLATDDEPVLTAYAWGVVILGQALAPLVVAVTAAVAAVVLLLLAMALAFRAGRGEARDARTASRLTAIIAARALGVSPGALAGGGRASELLRSILDRPYDRIIGRMLAG